MKTVQVLLSSYNGEKYIKQQIDSILAQKGVNVRLLVRDDGSMDSTVEIVKGYERVDIIEGENQGSTESFLTLIELAPEADYYAFCDQDDVWDTDKIEIAVKVLEEYSDKPAIYSGNARLVDGDLNFIKNEDLNPMTTLGSAIIKNYATGCTVVFNKSLMKELKKYRPVNVPFHDWWVNLVCLAVGGVSIYDIEPHMSYRQHGNNAVSGNDSAWKKWSSRLKKLSKPYYRDHMSEEILNHLEVSGQEKAILEAIASGNSKKISKACIRTGNKIDDFLFHICVRIRKI